VPGAPDRDRALAAHHVRRPLRRPGSGRAPAPDDLRVGEYRALPEPVGLRITAIRFGLRPSERNFEHFSRLAFFDLDAARRREGDRLAAFSEYTRSRATVPHVKRTMRRLVSSGTKRVPDAELRRIGAPTELIWGRHDRFVPLSMAEAASARLGWPLHVIEAAGHVPHIERPDDFLEVVP